DAFIAQNEAQQQPQAQTQQQPDQPQQSSSTDELAQDWERTPPSVKKALEETSQQFNQAQQAYAAASLQAAQTAASALFLDFPELAGLSADQLPTAISVIQKQNPERGLQIHARIAGVKNLYDQTQQLQQQQAIQQQQAAKEQFEQWSRQEDSKFE